MKQQEKVFPEAEVDVVIFSGTKIKSDNKILIKHIDNKKVYTIHKREYQSFKENQNQLFDIFVNETDRIIIKKTEQEQQRINDIFTVSRGIHPYRRDGYGKSKYTKGFQTEEDYKNRSYHNKEKIDKTYKLELKGSDEKSEILKIVKQIKTLKNKNISTDISIQTNKIDNLIYKMYKLSKKEIIHIERNYMMK